FGGLRMDNVKFGYANDRVILDNVTFSVAEGKSLALVGASGSGKSTIIRLLYRLYNVKDGCVSMGGMDVKMLDLKQLRMSMGIVPQDCVLFNETIEYNIRYGRPDATFEEVEDAAKAAQIHDFILQHPDGYKCLVGERGLKLS
ncbi:UNVERIFIED_CONTAM: ATP-binding cassette sub-family B member 6, mitochondrial, partial [Eudyptes robustus]